MPDIRELNETASKIASTKSTDKNKFLLEKQNLLNQTRVPVKEEIKNNYSNILNIAPTFHFIPIYPLESQEEQILKHLKETVEWVREQEGILLAFVYQLLELGEVLNQSNLPKYVLLFLTEDKDVLVRLKETSKGNELRKLLLELTGGKSGKDESLISINSLLIGIE